MNTVYFFVCMSKHVEFRGQPQVLLPSLQLPRILQQDLTLTGREPQGGFLYAGITSGGTISGFFWWVTYLQGKHFNDGVISPVAGPF